MCFCFFGEEHMKTAFLILMTASMAAYGQDAGMAAAQASEMAAQQSMQAAQMANQQATQTNLDTGSTNGFARRPAFSVKSGPVTAGTIVRLKSSTRHSVIYYTTDGWTPTVSSTRYTGPIQIDQATHL